MSETPSNLVVKGRSDDVLPEHAVGLILYQVGSALWQVYSRDDLEESYEIKCRRSGVCVGTTTGGELFIQTHGVLPSTRVSGDIAAATEAGLLGSLEILYPEGAEPDETEEADESQPQS